MPYYTAAAKHRQQGRRDREILAQIDADRMQAGPRIAMDDHTIIIPSRWFNANAASFWASYGFTFYRGTYSWKRNANKPHKGKMYTAKAWLQSTRREFFSFWPQLVADRECTACKETFAPQDKNQVLCTDCIDVAQANVDHHNQGD